VTDEQNPMVAISQDSAIETDSVTDLRQASNPELSPEIEVGSDTKYGSVAEQEETVRVITRTVQDNSNAEAKGAYIVLRVNAIYRFELSKKR